MMDRLSNIPGRGRQEEEGGDVDCNYDILTKLTSYHQLGRISIANQYPVRSTLWVS